MTIVHEAGNIHRNYDGICREALANAPDNPVYVPLEAEPQIPIEGINITDIGTQSFGEVRESYKQYSNFHILTALLNKNFKYTALLNSLDEIWKNSYSEDRFHLFDSMIYHRTKHSCNTSVHSSTGPTPAILEKGWDASIPAVTLRKDLIDFNISASSFKLMLDKVKHYAKQIINDAFDYVKQKWDKSHRVPDLRVEELVLVSTFNFNNIKGPKKLKDPYLEPFVIISLHVTNSVQVQLSGELEQQILPSHSA
ncbi:hypothetical protein O181_022256 [Austropuccinia psidii MF-1]|uniref:Uncharacterized protein n=1 Tax=Austropuccinia psidii MF-1 TaxID=1389203 RepID=A0A9Q3CH30_9BASI|nr:hypothetical protein [Austropuccinia psidii MF-1]